MARQSLDGALSAGASPKQSMRLGKALQQRIRERAEEEEIPISRLVRNALVQYLDDAENGGTEHGRGNRDS